MFRIGDEVRYRLIGPIGVIKDLQNIEDGSYGVSFYNWKWGHNLNGTLEAHDKSGVYCLEEQLTLISLDLENV